MNNLLIISDSNNNTTKSALACKLISEISTSHEVTAIKVIANFEKACKLCVSILNEEDYIILEERLEDQSTDSGRMKSAGAHTVWSIQAKGKGLERCFAKLKDILPKDSPIIADSNELMKFVKPGYLILDPNDNFRVRFADGKWE